MKKRLCILIFCILIVCTACTNKNDGREPEEEQITEETQIPEPQPEPLSFPYAEQNKATNQSDCDETYRYFIKKRENKSEIYKALLSDTDSETELMFSTEKSLRPTLSNYHDYLLVQGEDYEWLKLNKKTLKLTPLLKSLPKGQRWLYFDKITGDKFVATLETYVSDEEASIKEKYLINISPINKEKDPTYEPIIEELETGMASEIRYYFGIEFKHIKPDVKAVNVKGTLYFNNTYLNYVTYYWVTNDYVFYMLRDDGFPVGEPRRYTMWRCKLDGTDNKEILRMSDTDMSYVSSFNYDEKYIYFTCFPLEPHRDEEHHIMKNLYRCDYDGKNVKALCPGEVEGSNHFEVYDGYIFFSLSENVIGEVNYFRMKSDGSELIEAYN